MASSQELLLTAGPVATPNYIEDVFSAYSFSITNTSPTTITNGMNLATTGGMFWMKGRNFVGNHYIYDTAMSGSSSSGPISPNLTSGAPTANVSFPTFRTDGITINYDGSMTPSGTYMSWTPLKKTKFFDIVTYTGTGSARTVAHNLGATPGCIIVKRTDSTGNWGVYHRSIANTDFLLLNQSAAKQTSSSYWNNTTPTSTEFSVGSNIAVNASGGTYVAYLFAHDAGGFGAFGTDNVISCGSFTTSAGSPVATVTLGYEPQWVLVKDSANTGNWYILDSIRGMSYSTDAYLYTNATDAEGSTGGGFTPTATGFTTQGLLGYGTFIYIAIRRGPMKVPTDATKVFKSVLWTGNDAASRNISGIGFVPDVANLDRRSATGSYFTSGFYDRLRGTPVLATSSTQTESYWAGTAMNMGAFGQADLTLPSNAIQWNDSPTTFVGQFFQRAPSFMDEVCYTGTGSATTVTHNLGVAPELMIVKRRAGSEAGGVAGYWVVYSAALGNGSCLFLNTTAATNTAGVWNNTSPTSTAFTVSNNYVNYSGDTYVAYLFATCAGVSKVGSYTGTGTLTTINCGFVGGARFVMIKRTDSTSNWYVWDSTRGMVAGTDPWYAMNLWAAESNNNSTYTIATGFQLLASPSADVNTNGGSYIYLAIA